MRKRLPDPKDVLAGDCRTGDNIAVAVDSDLPQWDHFLMHYFSAEFPADFFVTMRFKERRKWSPEKVQRFGPGFEYRFAQEVGELLGIYTQQSPTADGP